MGKENIIALFIFSVALSICTTLSPPEVTADCSGMEYLLSGVGAIAPSCSTWALAAEHLDLNHPGKLGCDPSPESCGDYFWQSPLYGEVGWQSSALSPSGWGYMCTEIFNYSFPCDPSTVSGPVEVRVYTEGGGKWYHDSIPLSVYINGHKVGTRYSAPRWGQKTVCIRFSADTVLVHGANRITMTYEGGAGASRLTLIGWVSIVEDHPLAVETSTWGAIKAMYR